MLTSVLIDVSVLVSGWSIHRDWSTIMLHLQTCKNVTNYSIFRLKVLYPYLCYSEVVIIDKLGAPVLELCAQREVKGLKPTSAVFCP